MKPNRYLLYLLLLLLSSCISTKDIPEGDQLFTGLTRISYDADTLHTQYTTLYASHFADTKAEVEAALATAPTGALFGSSYFRVPFSWRLWVYNKYNGKESKFAKWMVKSFGRPPVLMSTVNPALPPWLSPCCAITGSSAPRWPTRPCHGAIPRKPR